MDGLLHIWDRWGRNGLRKKGLWGMEVKLLRIHQCSANDDLIVEMNISNYIEEISPSNLRINVDKAQNKYRNSITQITNV